MGKIINRARVLRQKVLATHTKNTLPASQLWMINHETMHRNAIETIDDECELIRFLTENNTFTFPRHTIDPRCVEITDKYLAYLEREGMPLGTLPPNIAESPLVSDKTLFKRSGRLLSTMFLLHLCVALRIKTHTVNLKTVVEIGGGYGNLARIMRLFYPAQTYYIVDLVDSLYCSYVFIAFHFPDARLLFVTDSRQLKSTDKLDFVFVPTEFVSGLRGKQIDLIINTCSLGEMTQSTVDHYMEFINDRLSVRYFYSINRFGKFDPASVDPDLCNVSVKLDRTWRILVWDAFGELGFSQIEVDAPPYLELLAEKMLPPTNADYLYQTAATFSFAVARQMQRRNSAWHFFMWNAIRLCPSRDLIREFLKDKEQSLFRDAPFYRDLYLHTEQIMLRLPVGVVLDSSPEALRRQLDQSDTERHKIQQALDTAHAKCAAVQQQLNDALVEHTAIQHELTNAHAERVAIQQELDSARLEHTLAQQEVGGVRAEWAAVKDALERSNVELTKLRNSQENAEVERLALHRELQRFGSERAELQQEIQDANVKFLALQLENEKARAGHRNLLSELQDVNNERMRLYQKLEKASAVRIEPNQELVNTLGQEVERLRTELLATYSSKSWRITRPLRQLSARVRSKIRI